MFYYVAQAALEFLIDLPQRPPPSVDGEQATRPFNLAGFKAHSSVALSTFIHYHANIPNAPHQKLLLP